MNIFDLLRLIRKHIVLLILTPVLLSSLVIFLTRKPTYKYTSETTLYTGIATGGGVEMDKSLSFFATNTAFDNLINVIKSRETQQEVGVRLLAQHLMLDKYDPSFLSKTSFQELRQITPSYIYKFIVRNVNTKSKPPVTKPVQTAPVEKPITPPSQKDYHTVKPGETIYRIAKQYGLSSEELMSLNDLSDNNIEPGQLLKTSIYAHDGENQKSPGGNQPATDTAETQKSRETFSFVQLDSTGMLQWLPASINLDAYEQTVENLMRYMAKSDTNFVYKLLNFKHPHYSINAISSVNVQRIASSDLVRLQYDSDDPGICQQTLAILTAVCIKNFKGIKENRSDAVVKYFEFQVKQASGRLKIAEDKLLKFNEDNNIINYYEQSKAVAVVKEDLDVNYNNMRIKLAGLQAAIARIEQKLNSQQKVQINGSQIVDQRNRLAETNMKIANIETVGGSDSMNITKLTKLKASALKLKTELSNSIAQLYTYGHTTDGLPLDGLLTDWLSNVLDYENTKAGITVLGDRIKEFQKQYAVYAPAGANLKRIEREINVSEQAYLELLHGLNLAKLKMQDIELSSNIKAVDPPYFPLSPNPTKRAMLIVVAGLLGFLLVLITILAMEYLDKSLRNPQKASKILNLESAGIFPKIFLELGTLNFPFIINRLEEMIIQQIEWHIKRQSGRLQPITILFFSTLSNEGKTIITGNIALKLKMQGKKVLLLNFSRESLHTQEISQPGYPETPPPSSTSGFVNSGKRGFYFQRLLGYPDTRVDYDSPFLQSPEEYLDPDEYFIYPVDHAYYTSSDYKDLLHNTQLTSNFNPDVVLIEIPPLLFYSYPPGLVSKPDAAILVCRSNRLWTPADQGALETVSQLIANPPMFLLNGVEISVIETHLGELPKKRSRFRRIFKKLIRFQFFDHYKL